MYVCASILQHLCAFLFKFCLGLGFFLIGFVSHIVFKGNLMLHRPKYFVCFCSYCEHWLKAKWGCYKLNLKRILQINQHTLVFLVGPCNSVLLTAEINNFNVLGLSELWKVLHMSLRSNLALPLMFRGGYCPLNLERQWLQFLSTTGKSIYYSLQETPFCRIFQEIN